MTASPPLSVSVSTMVAASPETIYDLITDVTRMGEWSPETVEARWMGGATTARPGARFVGTNVLGGLTWSTKPTVVTAERGVRFAFQVPGASGPLWSYDFDRADGGTRVTESMTQTKPSPAVIRWMRARAGVTDRGEHLRQAMCTTLDNLGAAAVAAAVAVAVAQASDPIR
ncbi:SRPBCC family protein [Pengzhenrongella phosphoraccumulans]|uniref:SRPBCC family protein n=1 Tax=Pengzhenrongella phosphoraccumulans TaxID=3114394 RepID=UPI00388DDD1F